MSEERAPDWAKKMVGRTIVKTQVSTDDHFLRFDFGEGEPLYLEAEGECCAHAYVHDVDDPGDLLAKVNRVDENHANVSSDTCEVVDAVFYAVHTDAGTVVIELRVEHNGYYSGTLEASTEAQAARRMSGEPVATWVDLWPRARCC